MKDVLYFFFKNNLKLIPFLVHLYNSNVFTFIAFLSEPQEFGFCGQAEILSLFTEAALPKKPG